MLANLEKINPNYWLNINTITGHAGHHWARLFSLGLWLAGMNLSLAQEGTVDTTFNNPKITGAANLLYVQKDGKIIFTQVNANNAGSTVGRLNADGTIDSSFKPGAGPTVITPAIDFGTVHFPAATNSSDVLAIAVQNDGKIWVGGPFNNYNGQPRNGLARLNADGSLDSFFSGVSGSGSGVRRLAIAANGKIYVAGDFSKLNGQSRRFGMVRLNADGSLDTSFQDASINIYASISDLSLRADGKLVVTANYASGTTPTSQVFRLNPDGSVDGSFQTGSGSTYTPAGFLHGMLPDERLLVFSGTGSYNGKTVNLGLFRLNTDGSLEANYAPDIKNGNFLVTLGPILSLPDGRTYIRGAFTTVNGSNRPGLARLNTDGSLDATIAPADAYLYTAMALQADGKLLVGTLFATTTGLKADIFRLNTKLQSDVPMALPAPLMKLARQAGALLITWDGAGRLQTANSLSGSWSNVATLNNQFSASTTKGQGFFRVIVP